MPFEGLTQGIQAAGSMFDMYNAPQLNQLNLLQQQAKLEQLRGLDPVSQLKIKKYQAALMGSMAKLALENPENRDGLFNAFESITGMKLGEESRTEESLKLASMAVDILKGEGKKQPFQQASVKGLEGYVFDPNTGQFFANPAIRQKISSLSQKPDLKMSDIRDINNDVTQLTKQAREARDGANALINIGDKPTPAQAVAAIFKFMKSLDPTSVVRQEEQGLVASASGPMEAFAGYINRLTGSGPLTTEVMQDIITTASGIANSTISESKTVVDDFISVYPELDEQRRSSMLGRVPELLKPPEFKTKEKTVSPGSSGQGKRSKTNTFTLPNGVEVKRVQ